MTEIIEHIIAADLMPPAGHYCHATTYKDLVFVSGQLPVQADGTHMFELSFEEQVQQALSNVFSVLKAAGSKPEHVLKITAYIVGVENLTAFNKIYSTTFNQIRPARSVVPVSELHFGYLVELEAIAVRALAAD